MNMGYPRAQNAVSDESLNEETVGFSSKNIGFLSSGNPRAVDSEQGVED
jgi:hypothetical protein